QFGQLTMDNASNNDTGMEEIAKALRLRHMLVTAEGNRIRYAIRASSIHNLTHDEYLDVLNSDIVAAARALVIAIRASGLRREDFEVLIREGNMNREWVDEEGNFLEMPVLALLRDVDTRWSSTFLMINRLLVLYNVTKLLASDKYKTTLGPLALSPKQLEALDDIRKFLGALHAAQQLLSSQQTPTLCHVLPVYSKLVKTLAEVKDICPKISHGIQKSIDKLNEYMAKAKDNRTYALAMIINPFFKFTWLEAEAPDEVEGHRHALEEAVSNCSSAFQDSDRSSDVFLP
ncbi:ribonuclease H-like domain-containing protein, partial [Schizophyllum commune]